MHGWQRRWPAGFSEVRAMENNMVTIPVNQYEEMIRDQRTLEMITALIQVSFVSEDQLRALCGLQPKGEEDLNKLFAAEPGEPEPLPAGCPKEVPCGEPAIMIENVEEPAAKPEVAPPRKRIDRGKLMALHNAGWTQRAIAEELGCAESSVSMILKEEKK